MKAFLALTILPLAASATRILLPLYVYPSAVYNDNASNWQSLLTTIRNHPAVNFDIVINPDSGPGGVGFGKDDINYRTGVQLLNAQSNVRTLGYVHTNYGGIPASNVSNNVTTWASWPSPYNVNGIFFDETPNSNGRTPNEATYMSGLASTTRSTAGTVGGKLVYNVGQKVVPANEASYFGSGGGDSVIVFEQTWAVYQTTNPVANNVPSGKAAKCALVTHTFSGTLAALTTAINNVRTAGIGSVWFTTTDYHQYTAPAANAENQASLLP